VAVGMVVSVGGKMVYVGVGMGASIFGAHPTSRIKIPRDRMKIQTLPD